MRAMTATAGHRDSQRSVASDLGATTDEDPALRSRPLPYAGTSLSEGLSVEVESAPPAESQASPAKPARSPKDQSTSSALGPAATTAPLPPPPPPPQRPSPQDRPQVSLSKLDELKTALAAQKAERENSAAQQIVSAKVLRFAVRTPQTHSD